jgi:hypothetical protein
MAPRSLTPGKFYRYISNTGPRLIQLTYLGDDGLWRANNLLTNREIKIKKPKLLIDASFSGYGFPMNDTMIRYKVIYRPVGHKNKTQGLQYGNDVLDLEAAKELAKLYTRLHPNEVASVIAATWFMVSFSKIWRFMYDGNKDEYLEMEQLDKDEIEDEQEKEELRQTYYWRRRRYNAKGEEIEFTNEDREGEAEKD